MCIYANSARVEAGTRRAEVRALGPLPAGAPVVPASRRALLPCPQAVRRPPPPRGGHTTTQRTRPRPRGPPRGTAQRPMPIRETLQTRGSRRTFQLRPPGSRPPCLQRQDPRNVETRLPHTLCQTQPRAHRPRPKKIMFEDEQPPKAFQGAKRPVGVISQGRKPRPHSVPDYELKYPPVSTARERSRYAAVFQDQYSEFLELHQEVDSAQAKLQQLQTLLSSLPPPRSQKEAHVTARVWREFEKKQMDPSFLDKQARYHYLKGKLKHLKTQIQKFDDQGDSEGSVYF